MGFAVVLATAHACVLRGLGCGGKWVEARSELAHPLEARALTSGRAGSQGGALSYRSVAQCYSSAVGKEAGTLGPTEAANSSAVAQLLAALQALCRKSASSPTAESGTSPTIL